MKLHIDYLETIREKYEFLKNENNLLTRRINDISSFRNDTEYNILKTENKNLKELIKLNEVYYKNKETGMITKLNELKKRLYLNEECKMNTSVDKVKRLNTISMKEDIFEKVYYI
jgi:hypothetical protein